MNKTLRNILAAIGLATVAALVFIQYSTPAKATGRVAWRYTTNIVVWGQTLSGEVSCVVSPSPGGSRDRHISVFSNTNTVAGKDIYVRFDSTFRTNEYNAGNWDIVIPANSTVAVPYGEGYDGAISVRQTNSAFLTLVYWEGGS